MLPLQGMPQIAGEDKGITADVYEIFAPGCIDAKLQAVETDGFGIAFRTRHG